jgi:hypothetical protein
LRFVSPKMERNTFWVAATLPLVNALQKALWQTAQGMTIWGIPALVAAIVIEPSVIDREH